MKKNKRDGAEEKSNISQREDAVGGARERVEPDRGAGPKRPKGGRKTGDAGKISFLPRALREQLNTRFRDGERAGSLLEWLNSLPETRQVADRHFGGRLLNKENLRVWRTGSYQEWLKDQRQVEHTVQVADRVLELSKKTGASLTEIAAKMFLCKIVDRLEQTTGSELASAELMNVAKAIGLLRKDERDGDASLLAREKFQLEQAKLEVARKAAEPRKPPTKEQIEEIERMLHIM